VGLRLSPIEEHWLPLARPLAIGQQVIRPHISSRTNPREATLPSLGRRTGLGRQPRRVTTQQVAITAVAQAISRPTARSYSNTDVLLGLESKTNSRKGRRNSPF
jgi:hypothetical protein